MSSKNSKTFDPHRLILNLREKRNFKGSDKYVVLSSPSICYTGKSIKKGYTKTSKQKTQRQRGMISFNYLMDYNTDQNLQIIFSIS